MHIKLQKNFFENEWVYSDTKTQVLPIRPTHQKFQICFIEENSYKNECQTYKMEPF